MRRDWLFVVGISLLGCKDKEPAATQATPAPAAAAPKGSAAPAPTGAATPAAPHEAPVTAAPTDRPSLDKAFADEPEDKVWADATEAAIKAVAPELTNVDCKQSQCQATLVAAGVAQVAMAVDQLETPEKLPATGAKNVILSAPEEGTGGRTTMKIFIRYDR